MKAIVAGCRDVTDFNLVQTAIDNSGFEITELVSGRATGVDALGERWARENSVKITTFPADWRTHGKAAGPIRNAQMAEYADALIAVWDGVSRGTKNMINEAKKRELNVYVFNFERE